jgi:hypothetical protein
LVIDAGVSVQATQLPAEHDFAVKQSQPVINSRFSCNKIFFAQLLFVALVIISNRKYLFLLYFTLPIPQLSQGSYLHVFLETLNNGGMSVTIVEDQIGLTAQRLRPFWTCSNRS